MKGDANPMSPSWEAGLAAMSRAPRCAAQSKRAGLPCQAPAASGWRVSYHHGAAGGHQAGPAHPTWKHGARSRSAVELRRLVSQLARKAREV
jgi:hypothetical protein